MGKDLFLDILITAGAGRLLSKTVSGFAVRRSMGDFITGSVCRNTVGVFGLCSEHEKFKQDSKLKIGRKACRYMDARKLSFIAVFGYSNFMTV